MHFGLVGRASKLRLLQAASDGVSVGIVRITEGQCRTNPKAGLLGGVDRMVVGAMSHHPVAIRAARLGNFSGVVTGIVLGEVVPRRRGRKAGIELSILDHAAHDANYAAEDHSSD
jgi:hypothetical protein